MTDLSNTSGDGPQLKRTVGVWQLMLYGLGSMLGSGVYVLIGKAAGLVGNAVWLSFLVALVAALMTALSYASLGSRHPRAGELGRPGRELKAIRITLSESHVARAQYEASLW